MLKFEKAPKDPWESSASTQRYRHSNDIHEHTWTHLSRKDQMGNQKDMALVRTRKRKNGVAGNRTQNLLHSVILEEQC
jgi:2',3'-cyclic-nucleotide 2'-phosphodiesterase (5'-nucleotidase family)